MVLQAARQCTYNYNKHVNVNVIQLRRSTSTSYFIVGCVVLKTYTRPPTWPQLQMEHGAIFTLLSKQRLSNVFQTGWQQPSWIMSWHRHFTFWNINKAVMSSGWQAVPKLASSLCRLHRPLLSHALFSVLMALLYLTFWSPVTLLWYSCTDRVKDVIYGALKSKAFMKGVAWYSLHSITKTLKVNLIIILKEAEE